MVDLAKQLREMADVKASVLYSKRKTLNEAADLIDRLNADADRVIEPFAKLGEAMRDSDKSSDRIAWGYNEADITVGDLRAARAYMEGE